MLEAFGVSPTAEALYLHLLRDPAQDMDELMRGLGRGREDVAGALDELSRPACEHARTNAAAVLPEEARTSTGGSAGSRPSTTAASRSLKVPVHAAPAAPRSGQYPVKETHRSSNPSSRPSRSARYATAPGEPGTVRTTGSQSAKR